MKDDEWESNVQMYNIGIRYFCDVGEKKKGWRCLKRWVVGFASPIWIYIMF